VRGSLPVSIACAGLALLMLGAPARVAAQAPQASQAFQTYKTPDWFFFAKYEYNHEENYEVSPHKAVGTIPADIKAMDGKKIMIYGILTPLDFKDGYATKFILVATVDVCGYGVNPRINEWMDVQMAPGLKAKVQNAPGLAMEGTVYGTFSLREVVDKSNRILSLYHMVADKVQ
jgi:hypothetical protein